MYPEDRITATQLVMLLSTSVFGTQYLLMPRIIASWVGRDGWILLSLSGLVAAIVVTLIIVLNRRYEGKDILEFASVILGRWFGFLFIGFFVALFYLLSTYTLRSFGDVIKLFLLKRTPLEVIILAMLFTVAYLLGHGMNPLARAAQVFFPIIALFIGVVFLGVQPLADYTEVLPVFGQGLVSLVKAAPVSCAFFVGYSAVGIFAPLLREPGRALSAGLAAVGLTLFGYVVSYIIVLAVFGPKESEYLVYPVVELARTIDVPGALAERIDSLMMALWIMTDFIAVSFSYFIASFSLAKLTGLKEIRPLIWVLIPFLYFGAMLPRDMGAAQMLSWVLYYLSMVVIGFIVLMFLISLRKGKGHAG